MTRQQIFDFAADKGLTIYMDDICHHKNPDDDFDFIVIGGDAFNGLAFVMRNQGEHDGRFFEIGMYDVEKAIEEAKRLFLR